MLIFVGDPQIVTDVTQNHLQGRNNNEVRGLWIQGQTMRLAPRHVATFFPNLEAIFFHSNGLEELSPEDFSGLRNLRELQINNNPLRYAENGAFRNLNHLSVLHFNRATCINAVSGGKTQVDNLIFRLLTSCPPSLRP